VTKTILQINYRYNTSRADYTALVTPSAEFIATVPGLVWKTWLMNEAEHEAGCIYLFESRETAQAWVDSKVVADFAAHSALSAFSVKMFEAMVPISLVTRAPLAMPVAA
jgi:Putative mono-oxygenase ydhR